MGIRTRNNCYLSRNMSPITSHSTRIRLTYYQNIKHFIQLLLLIVPVTASNIKIASMQQRTQSAACTSKKVLCSTPFENIHPQTLELLFINELKMFPFSILDTICQYLFHFKRITSELYHVPGKIFVATTGTPACASYIIGADTNLFTVLTSPAKKIYMKDNRRAPITALTLIGNTLVASGDSDGIINVWDIHTRARQRTLITGKPIIALASLDQEFLAVGFRTIIQLWNWKNLRERASRQSKSHFLTTKKLFMITKKPCMIVSASPAGKIFRWNTHNNSYYFDDLHLSDSINCIASLSNNLIGIGTQKGRLIMWDVILSRQLRSLKHDCSITAIAYNPTNKIIGFGDKKGQICWLSHITRNVYTKLTTNGPPIEHLEIDHDPFSIYSIFYSTAP